MEREATKLWKKYHIVLMVTELVQPIKNMGDFESVSIEYEVDEQYSGIGFVLADGNNFVCLDIDNAIDKRTNQF